MTPNPHKMDMPLAEARRFLRQNPVYVEGWGRAEMHPHIVTRRHVGGNWPTEDRDLIRKAQLQHDAGVVSMCQGRDGEYIIQYAVPNKSPARRDAYFTKET